MTNAELIAELRGHILSVPLTLLHDAADALEADEQRIDGLQKLVDINTERCEALRKQLREAHENYEKHLNELTTKRNQLQAAVDNYEKRIAELEAQLPKEGEWLRTDAFPHRIYCSVCYKTYVPNDRWQIWVDGDIPKKFCPNCGARMKGEQE